MYWRLWLRRLGQLWARVFPRGLVRSPWLIIVVVALLVISPGLAWKFHARGRLRTIKGKINNIGSPDYANHGNPGGIAPIVLKRDASVGGEVPEFTSATLLPGLGMGVLQITATLPGHGSMNLLSAPTVQAIAGGTTAAPAGIDNDYGAFEVPWGGQFLGTATPSGTSVMANWRGIGIEESTDGSADPNAAEGGNLRAVGADDSSSTKTATGMKAQAVFRALNSDGRWPSQTDVSVQAQLSGQALDLTVVAKNTGERTEPLGIGWSPRFLVSPDREGVELQLPGGKILEMEPSKGLPSGRFATAGPVVSRFQTQPAKLGPDSFDRTLVEMKPGAGAEGPVFEILNPAAGYGLRLTALSPAIRAARVVAPSGVDYVAIDLQTNMDDPLGKEWNDNGIAAIEPGETVEWKVRLEIFAVPKQ